MTILTFLQVLGLQEQQLQVRILIIISVISGRLLQKSSARLQSYLERRIFTSFEIPILDPSYPWILEWLTKHEAKSLLKSSRFFLQPPPPHHISVNTTFLKRENGSTEATTNLRPGIGNYFIQYKNIWIRVRLNFTFLTRLKGVET